MTQTTSPVERQSFTPGPWRVGDAAHTIFGPPNGTPAPKMIATMARFGAIELRANARLIAKAPELYALLRKIADTPCNHGPQEFCPREDAAKLLAEIDQA